MYLLIIIYKPTCFSLKFRMIGSESIKVKLFRVNTCMHLEQLLDPSKTTLFSLLLYGHVL